MRAVAFDGRGGVCIVERPTPKPGPTQVLVAPRFAALNPADLLQRDGKYPAPPGVPEDVGGLEVAGVVVDTGGLVRRWRVGDRVFGIVGGGGLAELVLADESCLAFVPEELDELTAAASPEVVITAHDAIRSQAALAPGETLLVHGASGGVGSAAVQIGVALGACAVGVVRSTAGLEYVESLGAIAVLNEGFEDAVRARLGADSVDVVVELVSGAHLQPNVSVLAPLGRIIVVGVGAGDQADLRLFDLMRKRATVRGTVLRSRSVEEKARAVTAFTEEIVPLMIERRIVTRIDSVFPLAKVEEGFARMAVPGRTGKVLLDVRDRDA